MAGATGATILHADLDAFYASVEQLLDPALQGRPVAVGGGVVLAASYEARAFGVRGGMPGRQAKVLCPDLIVVGGHFREYQRLGDRVVDVFHDLTPLVERVSIDEAFLDVSGSVHLFGPPAVIAETIRRRVRDEIGLPISVGVATTKHLAKVASQVAKPDGLVVVAPDDERAFLAPLPVGLLWGVGPVTRTRLAERGIHTIGELAEASPEMLDALLGRSLTARLTSLAANVDRRDVRSGRRAASVGAQSALGRTVPTPALVRRTFAYLADRVATRLRASARAGRTVTVRVRFADMRAITRSRTMVGPTASTGTLTDVAVELTTRALGDHPEERHVSLLAIAVSNLTPARPEQLELPLPLAGVSERRRAGTAVLDHVVDQVRDRFGRDAVGLAALRFGSVGAVPDGFRELAERDLDP
ncbi:MAG: DNA polymerase IV [Acidimicrobiales bacterium]